MKFKLDKNFSHRLTSGALSFLLAVSAATCLGGCSQSYNKDDNTNHVIESIADNKDDVDYNLDIQLPSYYKTFNLNNKPEIDASHYNVAYAKLLNESVPLFLKWIGPKLGYNTISSQDVEEMLKRLKTESSIFDEDISKGNHAKVLAYDNCGLLFRLSGNSHFEVMVYTDNNTGYLVIFDDVTIESYEDLNYTTAYSASDKKIYAYDRTKDQLTIIENAIYIGCENNIVSFIKPDDNQNLYFYDTKNMRETKEKISLLKFHGAHNEYITYVKSEIIKNNDEQNILYVFDNINKKMETKTLGKENFWMELQDSSILYAQKDGNAIQYDKGYTILNGDLESDYCVFSNLSSSHIGSARFYENRIYYNRKLNISCAIPYFETMLEHDTSKGYFTYQEIDGSKCLFDLTTLKAYFIYETIESPTYTILNVNSYPSDQKGINYSLFKDKNGKTVASIKGGWGAPYIERYFEQNKTAIQCSHKKIISDETIFYNATLLDLSDMDNPKDIFKSNNYLNLITTPINNVLIVGNVSKKISKLIDYNGNSITVYHDRIMIDSKPEQGIYIATLIDFNDAGNEKRDYIVFDQSGKILENNYTKISDVGYSKKLTLN